VIKLNPLVRPVGQAAQLWLPVQRLK